MMLCFLLLLAVLAAGAPQMAPFMADECLLSMPDVDSIEYTMKEYMSLVENINKCVERLNQQGEFIYVPAYPGSLHTSLFDRSHVWSQLNSILLTFHSPGSV